ncbi:MAG: DUF2202 domain-containing protein [Cyclobacteriaceae bacterium]|nr:DUF2202 domain-containing protein [Cyclobacteriaceae bacterium]
MKPLVSYTFVVLLVLLLGQSSGVKENLDKKLWYQIELEKVAMDYYDAMYKKWDVLAFRNLSRSEKKHMECVQLLMKEVGNPGLIDLQPVGKFKHMDLQDLYGKVIKLGNESVNKAFIASANLEEKNIKDVEDLLTLSEDEEYQFVLKNLLNSSKCHLNLMVCQLKNKGVGYKPVLLTINEYIDCLQTTPGEIDAKLTNCPEEEYDCPFKDNF